MRKGKQNWRLGLVAVACLLFSCDQDPFGLSHRQIAGDYALNRWEDGRTYYLLDTKQDEQSGGGVLDGVVERIGWNAAYIVARRRANFGGDPNGWMIVNVARKTISGPYGDDAIEAMPETSGMRFMDARAAWEALRQ